MSDEPGHYEVPAVVATPAPSRRGSIGWLVVGAVTGLAVLGLGTVGGLVLLLVAIAAIVVLWRRVPGGRPFGLVTFGALPAAILFFAASDHTGCPNGGKVALHAGELGKHQLVDCSQVVAGYVSMAVFFTMTTVAGVIWLAASRNARRHAAAATTDELAVPAT